jgi:hypothetical protein
VIQAAAGKFCIALEAWEDNDAPKVIMSEMPRPKNYFLPSMFWHWQNIHRRYQDWKL